MGVIIPLLVWEHFFWLKTENFAKKDHWRHWQEPHVTLHKLYILLRNQLVFKICHMATQLPLFDSR